MDRAWLTKQSFEIKYTPLAEVAELADALRSGRSELTLVRVQIPPSAHKKTALQRFFCVLMRVSIFGGPRDWGFLPVV